MLRLGKCLVEVGGKKRGDVVLAHRCVEKVARKRRVENEALDGKIVFKQKTAYEIYRCDWSSDVCSSDLELEE